VKIFSFFSTTDRSAGFTLLELLIAVTIFAVGLLTVAGMQITAMQAGTTAQTQSVATALAQGVFEELMSRDPGDAVFKVDADEEPYAIDQDILDQLAGGDNYQAFYSISPDTPATGMARVDVRVTGNNRSVRLSGFKRTL
jgi:type IV pilus assembly protein PilV